MEGLRVGLALLLGHRPPGDVGLDTEDRLDPAGLARLVEGHGPVEGAVIGQGEAVESLLGGRIDEVRDPPQPVEQAELGVDVEVGEVIGSQGRHGRSMVARWQAYRPGNGRPPPSPCEVILPRSGRRDEN